MSPNTDDFPFQPMSRASSLIKPLFDCTQDHERYEHYGNRQNLQSTTDKPMPWGFSRCELLPFMGSFTVHHINTLFLQTSKHIRNPIWGNITNCDYLQYHCDFTKYHCDFLHIYKTMLECGTTNQSNSERLVVCENSNLILACTLRHTHICAHKSGGCDMLLRS